MTSSARYLYLYVIFFYFFFFMYNAYKQTAVLKLFIITLLYSVFIFSELLHS